MSSRPELKVEDEAGFIGFFRSLPQKDAETIRIFNRSDFYAAHGEDAAFIARTVSMTIVDMALLMNHGSGLQDDLRYTSIGQSGHRIAFSHNDSYSIPKLFARGTI